MSESATWSQFVANWQLYGDTVICDAIAGLVLGYLSVFVVIRRMVFFSAAVTQAAGFGVALSFYLAIHFGVDLGPNAMAVAVSALMAALLIIEPRRLGMTRETLLALAFLFAAGGSMLLSVRIKQEAHDIESILFGPGFLVTPDDFRRVWTTGALVLAVQLWWARGFVFASFDPTAARVQGVPVTFLDLTLLLSLAIVAGVAAQALGALPVFALSALPGAAALLIARGNLWLTFLVAAVIGAVSAAGGYVFAFLYDFPVGGSQTAAAVLIAVASLAIRSIVRTGLRLARPGAA